jgi:uncharacterized membrane protein YbhN (UPF0104 family)
LLLQCDWSQLGLAGVINLASLVAKAGVWYVLLRRAAPLRLSTAEAATFMGAAINSISVSVSGDVMRAQVATERDNVPFRAAAAALMLSRVVEGLALIMMAAIAVLVFPFSSAVRGCATLVLVLLGGFSIWCSRRPAQPSKASGRTGWRAELREYAAQSRVALAPALGLALLSWLGQWLTYYWSIRATHAHLSPEAALAGLLFANLTGILRLTPGNIGLMQGSLLVILRPFGVPGGEALAGGLALQAIQVLPVLGIATALAGGYGVRRVGQRRWETL